MAAKVVTASDKGPFKSFAQFYPFYLQVRSPNIIAMGITDLRLVNPSDTDSQYLPPLLIQEHIHPTNRLLHFMGTTVSILLLTYFILTQNWYRLWIPWVQGYAAAWIGHFVFEKNKPATFQHPIWSLMGDFCMWWDLLSGKLRLNGANLSWSPRSI